MTIKYLKKAIKYPSTDDTKTRTAVQNILNDIEKRREEGIKEITKKFDKYEGEIIVSKEKIEEAKKRLTKKQKTTFSLLMKELRSLERRRQNKEIGRAHV